MLNKFKYLVLILISFIFFSSSIYALPPVMTGDATLDFSTIPGVKVYTDLTGDVGVPALLGLGQTSGWDLTVGYMWYDITTDKLYVGLKCAQICGDADGNGDPSTGGPVFTGSVVTGGLGGTDTDWGPSEAGAFIINTDGIGNFNIIIGKKPGLTGIATWGIYYYDSLVASDAGNPANWLDADGSPSKPFFTTSSSLLMSTHDIEFVIDKFSELQGFDKTNLLIDAYFGSSGDDGIGEDYIANTGTSYSIQQLTVKKIVNNIHGGTKIPTDFPLSVANYGNVTHNTPVSVLTDVSYTVSESAVAGYQQTGPVICLDDDTNSIVTHPVIFNPGQSITCTITNEDIAPKLKVVKQVINDNGGTKVATDFTLNISTIGTVIHDSYNNVLAGVAYTVSETQLAGYTQTSLTCKDDDTNAVLTHPVTLSPVQSVTCTIINDDLPNLGNYVWHDLNFDGVQDANEPGINGIKVNLYSSCSMSSPFMTTVTANNPIDGKSGYYLFKNLPITDCIYTVEFIKPTNSVFTIRDSATGNDNNDSDASLSDGKTTDISFSDDNDQLNWDAGIYFLACIGDMVFEDVNFNGIFDTGDLPIPNATVILKFPDNSNITTTTNAAGEYSFCNLVPGTYMMTIDRLQPALVTYPNFGYGYEATTEVAYIKTLAENEIFLDADFGFVGYSKIGDRIFVDNDKNCIFDSDNIGIKDVKVNLKDELGVQLQTTTTDVNGFYSFIVISGKKYSVVVDPTWNLNPVLTTSSPNCDLTKTTTTLTSNQFFDTADFGFRDHPFEISDPSQTICLGKDIVFLVDMKNNNPNEIYNISFTDELPNSTEYISFKSSLPYKSYTVVNNVLTVFFDKIPGNTRIYFEVTAKTLSKGEYDNISFAKDINGKLVSDIQHVKTTILDSGNPLCGELPKTGADFNWLLSLISLVITGTYLNRRKFYTV